MKRFLLSMFLVLGAASGCSTFDANDATVRENAIEVPGSQAEKAVTVGEVTSTTKFDIKADFRKTVKTSLANQGLLAGESTAHYTLSVTIQRWETPGPTDVSYDRRSTMEAVYRLRDTQSGEIAWSKSVVTTFNAPRSAGGDGGIKMEKIDAGGDRDRELGYPQSGTPLTARGPQRISIANAGAARTNIARFIEAFVQFMDEKS
jgi:hypothetical protein